MPRKRKPARLPGRPRVHDVRRSFALSLADEQAITTAARAADLTFSEFVRRAALRAAGTLTLGQLVAGDCFEADEDTGTLRALVLDSPAAPPGCRAIVDQRTGRAEVRPLGLVVRRIGPSDRY